MGGAQDPGARILSVDDEPSVRSLLNAILTRAGFHVDEACDGEEALKKMRESPPALALVDVRMPGIDGFELCRAIKSDPALRAVAVIMCTSESRKENLMEAIRAGAEDYILKPFTAEDVVRRIRRTLASRPAGTTPPVGPLSNLRRAARRSTRWKASWSALGLPGFQAGYKCRVFDISRVGMAMEFTRCSECTGYEQGAVHPKCLFAPVAAQFDRTHEIDFVLSISADVLLEVRGKIAHVLQSPDAPGTERVGVAFTGLSPECAAVIEQYVNGDLQL